MTCHVIRLAYCAYSTAFQVRHGRLSYHANGYVISRRALPSMVKVSSVDSSRSRTASHPATWDSVHTGDEKPAAVSKLYCVLL